MIHPLERFKLVAGAFDHAPDFEVSVPGVPRPQGSKTRTRYGGMRESSKYVKAWREKVTGFAFAARESVAATTVAALNSKSLEGPIVLGVEFVFSRPERHWARCAMCRSLKSGTCALRHRADGKRVRADAPTYVTSKPDVGKLLRAIEDSMTDAGAWCDDSQVVGYAGFPLTCKRYANPGEQPGARIKAWRLP